VSTSLRKQEGNQLVAEENEKYIKWCIEMLSTMKEICFVSTIVFLLSDDSHPSSKAFEDDSPERAQYKALCRQTLQIVLPGLRLQSGDRFTHWETWLRDLDTLGQTN
jgi:hypothetical protein